MQSLLRRKEVLSIQPPNFLLLSDFAERIDLERQVVRALSQCTFWIQVQCTSSVSSLLILEKT